MKPRDLALVVLINAVWGFNYVAGKYGVEHFPPLLFSTLRFVLVGLLLAFAFQGLRANWRLVLLIATFSGFLHFALIFIGLKLARDISAIAFVAQLGIPFATILGVVLLGEKIRWRRQLGIGVAFAGVVLMGFDERVFGYIDAVILTVLGAASMAFGQVLMRRLRGIGVFALQFWIALVSAPNLFVLSLLLEQEHTAAILSAGFWEWSAVVYSAIGASMIGHGGVYYLLHRYPVSVVAPSLQLAPLFGVLSGVLFMGDVLTARMVGGGVMILLGAFVITLREPGRMVHRLDETP
jgi:O-acetylserine/cysteine efflux transporter